MKAREERCFEFIPVNRREAKPRRHGITEMRGPYYAPVGRRYLQDVLETMGEYVDIFKFAGGSFRLMPKKAVRELIGICHDHDVLVSTGGFIERVLTHGEETTVRYLEECREIGFDIVEVSSGFVAVPPDDLVALVRRVSDLGMKPKPEVGIQFGAGGATAAKELEEEGTSDPSRAIRMAKRYLEAGAHLIMIESEGITESVTRWRTDVASRFANELGIENIMFEAADPEVFSWYVKNFGPEVNLFVDHSQVVQLESLRSGTWGTKSTWGRVITFRPGEGGGDGGAEP
jgi:phosphosulfolactate synthase (CoM biosynthesis protein A)